MVEVPNGSNGRDIGARGVRGGGKGFTIELSVKAYFVSLLQAGRKQKINKVEAELEKKKTRTQEKEMRF